MAGRGGRAGTVAHGVDWDLELGALADQMARKGHRSKALLFDDINGYPAGYRMLTAILSSRERLALTLGLAIDIASNMEFVQRWREREANLHLLPPREVQQGPIPENVVAGDDIDMLKFPAPRWHEHDGGRYIGTGDLVITRDPDAGWVNVG